MKILNPEIDIEIPKILNKLILDESKKSEHSRFKKGYYIEDLFMRIYSLLPWIKLITPLGQNQFPEDSKKELQVPDYEVIFETGNKENICILIEVKSVNGNKQNFELKKSQYKVLKEYSNKKKQPLLFAIFWKNKRKCGGEKYYVLPFDTNDEIKILMEQQFGNVKHIFDVYVNKKREEEKRGKIITLVPHSIEK